MPTATDLLQSLRDVAILEECQVDAVVSEFSASNDDAGDVAGELVRRGWLTRFQADRALQGESGQLFVGQYLLLDILGEGGMGRVYKALHRRLNRLVALKTIREECLSKDPDAASRFQREARAAAALNHPHIVTLYDFDQANGVQFLAMEYVNGPELGKLVKRNGPLPVEVASECIRQVSAGLQHAFENGMVHRDLKPSNLLALDPELSRRTGRAHLRTLRAEGEDAADTVHAAAERLPDRFVVKILDMGLVRMIDPKGERQSTLTQEGQLFGTPDFIAPEQARDARKADIRSDLYSLGCTYYYLLTGRPPFKGDSMLDVLLAHQLDEAKPVESLRPEVSPRVGAMVRKLMAKNPDERYQTPGELLEDLYGPRPASWPRVPDTVERVAGVIGGDTSETPPSGVVRPMGVTPSPSHPTPLPSALPLSGEVAKKIGEYRGHKAGVRALDFTSDRKYLASGSADGSVRIWAMNRQSNDRETLPVPSRADVRAVAFSQDRRLLAAAADAGAGTVWLWDRRAATSKPMVSLHGHQGTVECLAFCPASKLLASGASDRTLRIWDVETSRPRELSVLEGHTAAIQSIEFSPDARLLISGGSDGILHLWGLGKLWYEARQTLECHVGRIGATGFASDGLALATGGEDRLVKIWDVRTQRLLQRLSGHNAAVCGVHFSPDNRHLVSVDADGAVMLWDVSAGKRVFDWRLRLNSPAAAHAFTHDARYLASGLDDGTVVVHRLPFREMNL
jgi:serine/threonine protein kinase